MFITKNLIMIRCAKIVLHVVLYFILRKYKIKLGEYTTGLNVYIYFVDYIHFHLKRNILMQCKVRFSYNNSK